MRDDMIQGEAQQTASGWTPHNGGPCPVDPETRVEVKLREGEINRDFAKNYDWSDAGNQDAIIAYRIAQPEPNWREIADELARALSTIEKRETYTQTGLIAADALKAYTQAKERGE